MKSVIVLVLLAGVARAIKVSHVTCSRTYVKIGCYNDKTKPSRALPEQLITDRDKNSPNYQGHQIDWQNWGAYIHSLACRCADKANKLNYTVFGLQNYGECWSGPDAEKEYSLYGKSDSCYSNPCNVSNPLECVGMGGTNYVYRIKGDPCESKPCKNGGTCIKGANGFRCNCPPNYGGSTCENYDPCKSSPCKNGATCISLSAHGFHCHCPPNYGGSTCENDVDECFLINLCQNGGACVNTQGGFECDCQPGFTGKYCDKSCSTPVVDLCIVIDGSGSIGNNKYMAIKRVLLNLVDKLDVSKTKTHVAMIYYSDKPHIHGKLNDQMLYRNIMLKLSVLTMPFPDGETRTDLALDMVDKKIFTHGGGDRASIPDVLLVITDGFQGKGSAPIKDVVKPLKDRGVHIIAVGVHKADDLDLNGLKEIALQDKDVITTDEKDIENIPIERILKAIENVC